MSETDIQRDIKKSLELVGYTVLRVPVQPLTHTRGGKTFYKKNPLSGFPDLMVFLKNRRGVILGLEVKTKTGKQNENQVKMEMIFKSNNAEYIVCRSAEEALRKVGDIDLPCAICDTLEETGDDIAFIPKNNYPYL